MNMNDQQLLEIESRWKDRPDGSVRQLIRDDISALVAEIRRQRTAIRKVLVVFTDPESIPANLVEVVHALGEGIA